MAEMLVFEFGASLVDSGTGLALMPMHTAAANSNLALVEYFMREMGTSIDKADADRFTPLHFACLARSGDKPYMFATVKFLVEDSGADARIRSAKGEMPASIALKRGHHLIHGYLQNKEHATHEVALESLLAELEVEEEEAAAAAKAPKKGKKKKKKNRK